jgi:citrate synthase
MKTMDRTFYSLCEEIDDLKEAVAYWKGMYETERDENNKQLNERLEQSKKGVANALMFALSVSDDENGNLVISKENRKSLAENLK